MQSLEPFWNEINKGLKVENRFEDIGKKAEFSKEIQFSGTYWFFKEAMPETFLRLVEKEKAIERERIERKLVFNEILITREALEFLCLLPNNEEITDDLVSDPESKTKIIELLDIFLLLVKREEKRKFK